MGKYHILHLMMRSYDNAKRMLKVDRQPLNLLLHVVKSEK